MEENETHVIFETLTGSRLYGTDRPGSDYDYRGVALPPFKTFFGQGKFEQLEDKKSDRVIYNLVKFTQLALNANPNIIELLFVPEKYWKTASPIWRHILKFRELFVSTKCRFTFLGYAYSQLNRIKTHQKWLQNPPEKPDRREMGLSLESKIQEDAIKALKTIPASVLGDNFTVAIQKAMEVSLNAEQQASGIQALQTIPAEILRDSLRNVIQKEIEYYDKKKAWDSYRDWKENRNPARFKLEEQFGYDTKHAMHLVRLLRMGKEIIKTGQVIVDRREVDADELREILKGAMTYEELIAYAAKMEKEIVEYYDKSPLPRKPKIEKVDRLLLEIFSEFYSIDLELAETAVRRANEELGR